MTEVLPEGGESMTAVLQPGVYIGGKPAAGWAVQHKGCGRSWECDTGGHGSDDLPPGNALVGRGGGVR